MKRGSTPNHHINIENSAASGAEGRSISFSEIVMDNEQHMNVTNEMKFLDHLQSPLDNPSPSAALKTERKVIPALQQMGSTESCAHNKSACADTDENVGPKTD